MNKDRIRKQIRESLGGFSDYIEGGKTKGLTMDELTTILTNAAKGIKPNKPKAPIKEAEGQEPLPIPPGTTDVVDTITLDIPLFLLLLEYAREKSENDLDLHELVEAANKLGKERGILSTDDYTEITGEDGSAETEEISENFTQRLRENIKTSLQNRPIKEDKKVEKKEDTGEELDSKPKTDDVPAPEAPAPDAAPEGEEGEVPPPNPKATIANQGDGKVHPQVKAIQDALTQAQVAAQSLGDEKLLQQVGNTIVFFTKEYIVGSNKPQV